MEDLRALNLVLRFGLELCAILAFGYWGATLPLSTAMRVAAAVVAVITLVVFWGAFVSPKARYPSGRFGPTVLGLAVFLVAAAMLGARHHERLAVAFVAVSLVNSIILYVLPQSSISARDA